MQTSDQMLRAVFWLAGVLGRGLERGIAPLGPLVPGRVHLPRRAWVPLRASGGRERSEAGRPVTPVRESGRVPDVRPAQA